MPDGGTLTLKAENTNLDQLSVKMHHGAKAGPFVVVTVEDTGSGIPPEILERIFEPFFTTKDGSMGIGLAIGFRIIQDHGGLLYVTESKSGGAEFVIEFPLEGGSGPA